MCYANFTKLWRSEQTLLLHGTERDPFPLCCLTVIDQVGNSEPKTKTLTETFMQPTHKNQLKVLRCSYVQEGQLLEVPNSFGFFFISFDPPIYNSTNLTGQLSQGNNHLHKTNGDRLEETTDQFMVTLSTNFMKKTKVRG